jgi:hypothetical protein
MSTDQNFIVLKDIGDKQARYTNDIKLAAALVTRKYPIVQIRKQTNPRNNRAEVLFGFESSVELKEAEMSYLSGALTVDASSVLDNKDKLLSYVSNGTRTILDKLNS